MIESGATALFFFVLTVDMERPSYFFDGVFFVLTVDME